MSSPPNRLAAYRSYSYYQVLAICDSTTTAANLASTVSQNAWKHADPSKGRYSPKDLDGAPGSYCILINGSTDASYSITTVNWSSTTAGGATPGDRYTSVALEGSIDISEPKGIVFLDQVVKCCVSLNVDSSSAVFVLKTFFTGFGYNNTDGDFIDSITDVAPLMFTVTDMKGTFTELGGQYHMEGVSCVDGTARLPQYSKAGNSINIKGGSNLIDTIANYQKSIQNNYNKYYSCVTDQLTKALGAISADKNLAAKAIYPVKYQFDLSSFYDSSYMVTDQLEQLKTGTDCNAVPQISIPAGNSIEDGLHRIMLMSKEVKRDASTGKAGYKYEYRIRAAIHTDKIRDDSNRLSYTILYKIEPFLSVKTVADKHDAFAKYSSPTSSTDKSIADTIINFDYIYTGKNVDILEFDMKVNAGLAYLQAATTSNSYRGQLETAQSRASSISAVDLTQLVRMDPSKIIPKPIFFGSQVTSPQAKNTSDANNTLQAIYTLTKHASIELSEATVKIVGNPNLFSSVSATSSTTRLINTVNPVTSDVPLDVPNEADFRLWSYIPAFVKIKIKMPRNNDDIAAFNGTIDPFDANTGNLDYAQDFWFDGYYYVLGITHTFDSGVFTQVLHLLGIPPDGALSALTDLPTTTSKDLTQLIDSCYDGVSGCGPTTPVTGQVAKGDLTAKLVLAGHNPCGNNVRASEKGAAPCTTGPTDATAKP